MPGKPWDSAKTGPRHRQPNHISHDYAADPAHGERVPRCKVCGLPDMVGSRVLDGVWTRGSLSIPVRLCERCIGPRDPRDADPLTAEGAA